MIRVLIADDHEVIRFGLRVLINAAEDLELVGSAADGLAAVAMTLRQEPDVVLMDLSMPVLNGIQAIREITKLRPLTRTLVLTSYGKEPIVRDALEAGAAGYLLKDKSATAVTDAIRAVHRGEMPLTPAVARTRRR